MYTVNYGKFIFTEHELPRKQGFVHIITKVDLHVITEITEFSYTGDTKPVASKTIFHGRSHLPADVFMFMEHHHVLATHQHLLYSKCGVSVFLISQHR